MTQLIFSLTLIDCLGRGGSWLARNLSGPNLPAAEIATMVTHSGARPVAVSISHLANQQSLMDELRRLR